MSTTLPSTVASLAIPGARLHYEVRGHGPFVALVGAPMDATAFAALADRLAGDHTVLTTDPRGINRSVLDDPTLDSTPELRADDLSRLLAHLDAGPAAVFGSSGGAVTALALAQAHPEQVHTVIAHEPPLQDLLDDRAERHAATEDVIATYRSGDHGGAWFKFLANANITLTEEELAGMSPTEPDPQRDADEYRFMVHEMRATSRWRPDLTALRDGSPRIVVGIGEASAGQLCERTSTALAAAIGVEPTMFPGGHTGFVDDPDRFVVALRTVLRAG